MGQSQKARFFAGRLKFFISSADKKGMPLDLTECFRLMSKHSLSDLHLKAGAPPVARKDGRLIRFQKDSPGLTNQEINKAVEPYLKPWHRQILMDSKQVDFSHGIKGLGRFRFNIFYQRGTLRVVARNIPHTIPNYKSLHLPACVSRLARKWNDGLILVAGATGNGKSSTIVSMLNDINLNQSRHIITIEDPIEFLIEDKKSLITQRELGTDYIDYNSALKATLRQDPDVIFFGELRDFDSVETALSAANTGHLVFSTLHTNTSADTLHRVLGLISEERKKLFRMEFSACLRAVVCQKLILRKDKKGLIPAIEILINNPRARSFLEDKSKSVSLLNEVIERGKEVWGMQSFNQHLIELEERGLISRQTALQASPSPEKLQLHFGGLRSRAGSSDESLTQSKIYDVSNLHLKKEA